jgi:hypothetical protein
MGSVDEAEVFVPVIQQLGESQVDFGEVLVKMNGRLRRVAFLVTALPPLLRPPWLG